MADPTTPNVGFTLPAVGGDNNTWGQLTNTNWQLADALGGVQSTAQNASFTATPGVTAETVYRVTTGGVNISAALAPVLNKIVTIKKVDAGAGQVVISAVAPIEGQASYILENFGQYVRLQYNGTSYDIVGNN